MQCGVAITQHPLCMHRTYSPRTFVWLSQSNTAVKVPPGKVLTVDSSNVRDSAFLPVFMETLTSGGSSHIWISTRTWPEGAWHVTASQALFAPQVVEEREPSIATAISSTASHVASARARKTLSVSGVLFTGFTDESLVHAHIILILYLAGLARGKS